MQSIHDVAVVRMSPARMETYLRMANGSVASALDLYEWNGIVSAEFHRILGVVEVVLRNAISDVFVSHEAVGDTSKNWLLSPKIHLPARHRAQIEKVSADLVQRGDVLTLDAMIPELSFGFWRFLLTKRFASRYWPSTLRFAFPHVANVERPLLFERVGRLHRLRNRIAHHEPIFGRRLDLDHRDCLLVLGAICPVTARWVESQSRVPEVLAARPPV